MRHRHLLLSISLLIIVLLIVPPLTMGLTVAWASHIGLLDADAVVVASNAPALDRYMANVLGRAYGDRLQVCDGTADEVQINEAITAVAGGDTGLSAGSFTVAASVAVNQTGSSLSGRGWSTILTTGTALGASTGIIEITADECQVRDLAVDGNGATVASGCGLHVNNCDRTQLVCLLLERAKERNVLVDGGSAWTTIDRIVSRESYTDSVVISAANETQIMDSLIGAVDSSVRTTEDGLVLSNAQQTVVLGCLLDISRYSLYVYDSSNCRIEGNTIELARQHGLCFGGNSSGNIASGNVIRDNGKQTTTTYDGVYFSSTASRNVLKGNTIFNDTDYDGSHGTNRQRYGINVSAAGCVGNQVEGNELLHELGNGTAAISDSGTSTRISGNDGYLGRGETRTYALTMTAGAEHTATYVQNPYPQAVLITGAAFNLTTAASATAPTYDVALDADGAGVPDGTALITGAPDTVGTYLSWNDGAGAWDVQVAYVDLAAAGGASDYVGICIQTAAGADSAGVAYITMVGA